MKHPTTELHWLRSFDHAAVSCEDCAADLIPDGAAVQFATADEGRRYGWASWRRRCPHVKAAPRAAKRR